VRESLLSDAISLKMDDETGGVQELPGKKREQSEKVVDPDLVDRGFTCESNATKRFFVDDTEDQNTTKFPQVGTTCQ